MARRTSIGKGWARLVQQQTRWLMRQTASAGKKAVKRATASARSPTAAKASNAAGGRWNVGVAVGPAGARRYRLFTPTGLSSKKCAHPLIVMLHGCGQSASDFAASTRMNRLASLYGFLVLYPEQDRSANVQACWNWFDTRTGRALREATSIVAAIDHVLALRSAIDPSRVAIAGLSAGASMAALVALHYPDRFAAVAMHSGVEPTSASSSATALAAMRGRYRAGNQVVPGECPLVLPPLLVLQGSTDSVVLKTNGMRAAQAWATRTHAKPQSARVVRRGQRYPFTTMDWLVPQRRLQVTLSEIQGLNHAWSGGAASQAFSDPKGPDASRMVWAFAQKQFNVVARDRKSKV